MKTLIRCQSIHSAQNSGRHAGSNRLAFTLIELLIVVCIIAILSAIAVPNFLEASTRSKAVRAAADQRTIATALETYAIDNSGKYPAYGNPRDRALFAGEPVVFIPVSMTTPVAYLNVLPPDVFPGTRTGIDRSQADTYFYMNDYATTYLGKTQEEGHVALHYLELTGMLRPVKWTLWSFGPDLRDEHGIVMYDASNGTISRGDLMRFGP